MRNLTVAKRISLVLLASGMAISAHAQSRPDDITRLEETRRRIDHERQLIREGKMHWMLASSPLVLDDRFPVGPRTTAQTSHPTRAHNVNQPWGALIDGDDLVIDFEDPAYQIATLNPTTATPFISIEGVVDPQTGDTWWAPIGGEHTGIVDNNAAQSGPGWDPDGGDNDPLTEGVLDGDSDQHGEVGGPDPLGLHGKFLAAAAGTHIRTPPRTTATNRPQGWLRHQYYAPTASEPVVTIVDMYADREDSTTWWSPISDIEGARFVISSYWFGHNTYAPWAGSPIVDSDGIYRRPLILGPEALNPNLGEFYAIPASSPWRLKTDEWYSVAIRQTVDGYSVWVRDSQTIGVNGWEQNSIYDGIRGASDPSNTQGAFAGELFESDWLQLLPGVADDPGTSAVEGYGISVNLDSMVHPSTTDMTGSVVSPRGAYPPYADGVDSFHWRGGFEPSVTVMPTYTPNDVYIDNYVVLGSPSDGPSCRADLDYDDDVDGADLGILLTGWGSGLSSDINNDGTTNGADLGLLLANWGPCPE